MHRHGCCYNRPHSYLVVLISICSVLVPFFSEAALTEPFSSSSIDLGPLSAAPKSSSIASSAIPYSN